MNLTPSFCTCVTYQAIDTASVIAELLICSIKSKFMFVEYVEQSLQNCTRHVSSHDIFIQHLFSITQNNTYRKTTHSAEMET